MRKPHGKAVDTVSTYSVDSWSQGGKNTHKIKVLRETRFNHRTPPRLPPIVPLTFCSPTVIALPPIYYESDDECQLFSLVGRQRLKAFSFMSSRDKANTGGQYTCKGNQKALCNFSVFFFQLFFFFLMLK